jgi:CheY-like chemotaxis protein
MTRVLIVDDHELLRRGLREILTEAFPDLHLCEAVNAQEAMDAARKGNLAVVLVDINLPGRSGLDLLKELREECPRTPVVVLSAFPEQEYATSLPPWPNGSQPRLPGKSPLFLTRCFQPAKYRFCDSWRAVLLSRKSALNCASRLWSSSRWPG